MPISFINFFYIIRKKNALETTEKVSCSIIYFLMFAKSKFCCNFSRCFSFSIGVRAGGARGAAAPPNFGQLRFFGQQEKTWVKPVFKDVSMFFIITIF